MPMNSIAPALLLGLLAGSVAAQAPLAKLSVCDDGSEWPPYTYYERDAQGRSLGRLTGFAVDVLKAIARPDKVHLTIELLPWVRCQNEVDRGQDYQLALNASHSEERERRYWLTQAYYATTHHVFYSRRHYPQGLAVPNLESLGHYRVCGVRGYNYEAYKIPPEQLDAGARDFAAVVFKLHADRCQIALEKLEVVAGYRITGKDLLADPELGHAPIPGMARGEFHMIVSRQHPQGEALRNWLDAGIKRLRESGELQALSKRYLP